MTCDVTLMILLAAALHAGWNALIRISGDRIAVMAVVRNNALTGIPGGAMQAGAYRIIVYALAVAPVGMVSGLRETSVLFAALISAFLLKEGFGVWRFVSACLVAFGLIVSRSRS